MHLRLKIFILGIFMAAFALPANTQISAGINAGMTRMKFSGDPPEGIGYYAPKPGFSSSFRLDYRFNDAIALSIQPGLSVLRSKYVIMNDSATRAVDSTLFTLNSVSLPVQVIAWSENGRFYVLAGLQIDYTLSFKGDALLSSYTTSYEVTDYNFYMQFGAGFIVPLGKPYLSFELRYSQGFLDLTDVLVHQDAYLPRTKITNINFNVGLQVPLGRYSEKYQVKNKNQ